MLPPRILVPVIVACALFMENLDSTVLATSLPAIAADLNVDPIHLKLAVTSYLLSLAVFIPISGWMADRFGARLVFRGAMVVFTLGSILCGLVDTLGEIMAGRMLQGLGGAMMVPVGRLVILRSVPKSELVGALAWLTMPALIGPILGPPVGGFITTYLSWRWIFWINVPIGVLGLILATLYIPDIRGEQDRKFDFLGFLLAGLGLASFVSGATLLGLPFLPRPAVLALLAFGAVMLGLYVWHALRAPAPILDLRLFRIPTFRAGVLGGSIFRIGIGASPFLLPLLFQIGFGMNAFHSGLLTFMSACGALGSKAASVALMRRFGFRTTLVACTLIGGVLVAVPAFFTPGTSQALILGVLFISGVFRALQFTAINALGYADLEGTQMSSATSLSSVSQQLSLSVGVSVGAWMLEMALGGRGGANLRMDDFLPAFVTVGLISASAVFVFLRLDPDAGTEVSGHKRKPRQE